MRSLRYIKPMSSFEKRYYIQDPTFPQLLWRNTRLLWALFVGAVLWLTKGFLLRRALRKAAREHTVITLEDQLE